GVIGGGVEMVRTPSWRGRGLIVIVVRYRNSRWSQRRSPWSDPSSVEIEVGPRPVIDPPNEKNGVSPGDGRLTFVVALRCDRAREVNYTSALIDERAED